MAVVVLYACKGDEETFCLELKLHSNHCQQLLMFSEVHSFMVQKTFETNLKHNARSGLFPPSCVHFWLDIAECFMFQGRYANSLAPGRHTTFLLGLRNQSLHSPVRGVAHSPCVNGQLRLAPGQATEISPQDWEEHMLFTLAQHLIFFLVLCICQVEFRAAERDGYTCVWMHREYNC